MEEAGDEHVKMNLSVKRGMFGKAVYAAALRFGVPPSMLVVVDLCASYGKDYESVIRVGISPRNYIGFDCSQEDIEKGNRSCNVGNGAKALYYCDILKVDDTRDRIVKAMRERGLPPAHIVLCNFAVHHFDNNDSLFSIISPRASPGVARAGCHLVCALCDASRVRELCGEDGGSLPPGVVGHVSIENMARYDLIEGGKIRANIVRAGQAGGGRYFKSGHEERAVTLDAVMAAARRWGFAAACEGRHYRNNEIYNAELSGMPGGWASTRVMGNDMAKNLDAFLGVHATPILTHLPYERACGLLAGA